MIPLNNSHLAAIEETKTAITSMLMYSHKAFMDAGYSTDDAKKHVMKMVEGIHQSFGEAADVKVQPLGTALQKLEKVMESVKEQAKSSPAMREIYYDLLSIQAQLTKKR